MSPLVTIALLTLVVAVLIAIVLWSGGERPSWGDNADEPDVERRGRGRDQDDGDD